MNVVTITEKSRKVADMMGKRKVDILCVPETRWRGSEARNIGGGYKLFYHGMDGIRNGLGVILKEEYARNVVELKLRVSLMCVKVEIEGKVLNVVSGYV